MYIPRSVLAGRIVVYKIPRSEVMDAIYIVFIYMQQSVSFVNVPRDHVDVSGCQALATASGGWTSCCPLGHRGPVLLFGLDHSPDSMPACYLKPY